MFKGTFQYELWISYSNSKYRLIEVYPNPTMLQQEFERYCSLHTTKGDKVKAITRFKRES
jgi:hypothetical protein